MKRILFVDDDPAILASIGRALKRDRERWDMVFALGGEAGLVALRNRPFDVVVSDWEMPTVNGDVLLDVVKRESPRTGRIMLSGTEVEARIAPDVDEFLVKPCRAGTLRAALERLLRAADND